MAALIKYLRLLKQKPSLITRGAKALFSSAVLNRTAIRGVEFAVTYKCQAKCSKCSCRGLIEENRQELHKGQILEISRQIVGAGALFINLSGGEPLLREDIYEIVAKLSKMPALISLATNALLFSEPNIRKLKAAGLNVVQINMSSPFSEEHDREIGFKGSHAKVAEGIRMAKRLGIDVLINLVATREVLYSDRMEKMAMIARQNKCLLSLVLPARVGGWSDEKVNLGSQDYELIKKWLKMNFVVTDTQSCYRKGRCPAGTEKVYISPYGDIYPCPFIHTKYGNILKRGFAVLWEEMNTAQHSRCANIMETVN